MSPTFTRRLLHIGLALTGVSLCAQQIKPPEAAGALSGRARLRPQPADGNIPTSLAALHARAAADPAAARIAAAWDKAAHSLGARTIIHVDLRTGGPLAVEPDGLPWIPGTGVNNRLTRADMEKVSRGLAAPDLQRDPLDENGVNPAVLERIARDFMAQHPDWFPVPADQLRLHPAIPDPSHYVKHVLFDQVVNGVAVENALLVFHVGHGNLLSFGGQWLGPVTADTTPRLGLDAARHAALVHAGLTGKDVTFTGKPELLLVVVDDGPATQAGRGYSHRLVYSLTYRANGQPGTWRTEVDARTGEVIRFEDINDYGTIVGGVFPNSDDGICPTGCEQLGFPMPFADTGTAGVFTDTGGNYTQSSGTVTCTLTGKYVKSADTCGATSLAGAAPATLDFGASAGTDCITPGAGGAGNTHASRTAFYNVNKLKEEVRGWLPAWAFNNASVTVNVNLNQTCNAYWSPGAGTLNMFHDGGSTCRNTGEIAMIFDHELGHGYDQNDGGGAANPGEAYADNTATIHHHDACIGRGFFKTGVCGGYGDACTTCTGVRGSDWTKHVANRPHTVLDLQAGNNTAPNTPMSCPAGGDVCGFETHCAAYPITESVWDAAVIDLPHNPIPTNGGAACAGTSPGNPTTASQAWTLLSKLWWKSVGTLAGQYTCAVDGTAGCGATTTFHNLKVQDDDDGNLANGSPHAAELQCAFGRHQVGCVSEVNTDTSSCPALLAPTVTTTAGNNQVALSWTAVTNATQYRVFRNEEGCGAGYALIATLPAATLNYTDTGLLNGRTYYYQVQPVGGASNQCDGQPSACATDTPQPCVAPGTPSFGTVSNAPGTNNNTITFSNGVPPSDLYNVFRAVGTCAAPGTFVRIATGLAGSPYVDTTGSGGTTYAYKVAGTETTGLCQSALSAGCGEATDTGPCILPPTFAGAVSASNAQAFTCTATITWASGTKVCSGASSTVTYSVYRSTTPGFTPSAGNRIASGLIATSYNDSVGIVSGTVYYYIVHAVDSLGNEDTNAIEVNTFPTGPAGPGTFVEPYEGVSGAPVNTGWVVNNIVPGAFSPWIGSGAQKHAGAFSAFDADDAARSDHAFESPSWAIASNSTLTFWHTWSFENGNAVSACTNGAASCYDGGVLEYSRNGGAWTRITQAQISGPTYNGLIDNNATPATDNPLGNLVPAYVGGTGTLPAFAQSTVNLGTLAAGPANVKVRWRQGGDTSNLPNGSPVGWYLDDVQVSNLTAGVPTSCTTGSPCTAPGTPTFGGAVNSAGTNNNTISWSDGAPSSGKFNVYRATGTCAAPGPYARIAVGLAGSPYIDGAGTGGFTYAYKVSGTDPTGSCESALTSGCGEATTTGACTLSPTFAGATSASNNGTATCGLTVNWTAGTSNCSGPAPTYSVYRSTTSGFTPSGANRIASGIAGTSYGDTTALTNGTAYFYIVRAMDGIGNTDANLVEQSAAPSGPSSSNSYTSTDVPKTIPDNLPAGATSNLVIAGNPNPVSDVNVTLNVTMTYDGDLAFTLTSPGATTVPLITHRGAAGQNFTNTVLDDSAATPIGSGAAPFTGSFLPESPLAAVNGIPANGTWQLHGVDNAAIDTGTITGWSMAVTTSSACIAGSCPAPSGLGAPTAVDVNGCAAGIAVAWSVPGGWGDAGGTRTWTVLRDGVAVASGGCSGALSEATLNCLDTTAPAGSHTYAVRANNGCGTSLASAPSPGVSDAVTPNQIFHLQVQNTFVAGYKDMTNAAGFEAALQQQATANITAAGEFQIGATALQWISPAYASPVDLGSNPWTFDVYGLTTNAGAAGQLYAKVYKYNGGSPVLLFTTGYALPNISTAAAQTRFTWNYTPAPGTTLAGGDRLIAQVWLHATAGSTGGTATVNDVANADATAVKGTVTGTFARTNVCGEATNPLQTIAEVNVAGNRSLDHVWSIPLTAGSAHQFKAVASTDNVSQAFTLEWGTTTTGPWTPMFNITTTTMSCATPQTFTLPSAQTGTIYIHAVSTAPLNNSIQTLSVDYLDVDTTVPVPAPFFTLNYDFGTADSLLSAANCAGCAAAPAMSTVNGAKSGSDVVHNWPAVGGASSYNVYRDITANVSGWTGPAVASGLTGLSWPDANQLSNGTSQFYSVTDLNACGSESPK